MQKKFISYVCVLKKYINENVSFIEMPHNPIATSNSHIF